MHLNVYTYILEDNIESWQVAKKLFYIFIFLMFFFMLFFFHDFHLWIKKRFFF